jgi:hypothetical protein
MRSLLLVMLVCAGARAEPTVPMKPIADRTAACAAIRPDAKAKCLTVGKITVPGLGNVELHVAMGTGAMRYATVVDVAGKLWLSEPFAIVKSVCGMGGLCDVLDDAKPSLRTVTFAGKQLAAAVIDQRFHREHSDKAKPVIDERWTATALIACGAPTATPACTTRAWGERGNPCTVDVKPDGDVDAKCARDAGGGADALMADATKAYDRQDFDLALAKATAVLAKDPSNVRMLRLVVSIKCISGDAAAAKAAATKLPAADLAQMKIRCDRYGITL